MASDDRNDKMQPPTGDPSHSTRFGGPSPLTDVDRDALSAPKSEWMESTAAAAGDPVSDEEKRGLSILGGSSIRDGAVGGVSDPIRDGSGGPQERPEEGVRPGPRTSPERLDNADGTESGSAER
jgi:hypothetical protein